MNYDWLFRHILHRIGNRYGVNMVSGFKEVLFASTACVPGIWVRGLFIG
jgi:hypothetical protein